MAVGYFIDVQGTLLSDATKQPLDGAVELIAHLNHTKTPYVVITNNTKERSEDFLRSLHVKGLAIPKENYLDPFMVLQSRVKEKEIQAFGPHAFLDVLASLEYTLVQDKAKAILIASHQHFDASSFASMIEASIEGAKIIGMHGTSIYAKEGRRYPGVGAILSMLEYATGNKGEVVGKPSNAFYAKALEMIHAQDPSLCFEDITMISDDAMGDLVGAKGLGITTWLVLSGKCKDASEVEHVMTQLDAIYNHVGVILEELQ